MFSNLGFRFILVILYNVKQRKQRHERIKSADDVVRQIHNLDLHMTETWSAMTAHIIHTKTEKKKYKELKAITYPL
jgi:hypothetical protein